MVASWDTGKVLDLELKSKFYLVCLARRQMDETSQEFMDWWRCISQSVDCNYVGSSSEIYLQWSVEKYKLHYTTLIADGDSKTYNLITEKKPYDREVEVKKFECVGHVQKRMENRLLALKKTKVTDDSGKGVQWGEGGGGGGKKPPHQKYPSTSAEVLWESDQVLCE